MDAPGSSAAAASEPRPRCPAPCAFVIFGAGGDLTQRLLVPALYNLAASHLLPHGFAVIGVARSAASDADFHSRMAAALRQFATAPVDPAIAERLLARFSYLTGNFDDPATFARLRDRLGETARSAGTGDNALFYLATPPDLFAPIAEQLGRAGLASTEGQAWRRLIVEKPFGHDLASARELNRRLLAVFAEERVFRIDHYLGKETVQNIMVLRFANGLFEPLWSRVHIDHVQITVAETVTVGSRGKFYDRTGALRDMVPNHLFQLLALTAMEPPARFAADPVRDEKAKVIAALRPLGTSDVATEIVRAQYAAGETKGEPVAPYRASPGVAPGSATETFVALRLMIDNWRWAGVPFYLRTGKALAARRTEIAVKFKQAPLALFRDTPVDRLAQNVLVLRIQPDEGASLQFNAKVPGPHIRTDGVRMDFKYRDHFDAAPSTGYETLLYDCINGDATLFQRADMIEAGWRVVDPILERWSEGLATDLGHYSAGSQGPGAADRLLARDGHHWRTIA
jgi:glucose-6-phosphate 1-dehydrogenase